MSNPSATIDAPTPIAETEDTADHRAVATPSIVLAGDPKFQANLIILSFEIKTGNPEMDSFVTAGVKAVRSEVTASIAAAVAEIPDVIAFRDAEAAASRGTEEGERLRDSLARLQAELRKQIAAGADPVGLEDQITSTQADIGRVATRLAICRELVEDRRGRHDRAVRKAEELAREERLAAEASILLAQREELARVIAPLLTPIKRQQHVVASLKK